MTLDYKILWIDDNDKFFANHRDYIVEFLEEKGFEAKITEYKSFEEFVENEKSEAHQKIYDLFLIDLNLDNGNTGDQIINKIRKHVLTDIIFYSTSLKDVRDKINENNIEGIYATSRDKEDFEEKVIDVIDVTIKKVQDVNNLRGLIMAEVAELDRLKKSILLKYNAKDLNNIKFKKYVKEDIFKQINEELADLECVINPEYEHCDMDFEKLLNNFFYDSFKKSRTVFKVKRLDTKCVNIPFVHQDYYEKVIKKRNVFAHEEEKSREDGTKYLKYTDGTPLEFNEEHCIQIRKDIKAYKEILKDIETRLNE